MAVVVRETFSVGCMPPCGPPFPDDIPPWLPLPIPPPPPPLFRVLGPGDHLAEGSVDKGMTNGLLLLLYVVIPVICFAIVIFSSTRQRNNRPVGLKQSVIDSIAVFAYKKDELRVEGTECCVCLNEFQEDENLRLLPKCSHAFHVACIDPWLRSHKNCPLCRAPIVSDNFDAQSCCFWFHSSSGLSSREDTQVGNSQSGPAVISSQLGEGAARNESGIGDGEFVVSIPVEEEEEAAAGNSKMNSSDSVLKRSVSFDSFSAPAIYRAEANGKRQVKSGSQSGQLDSNRCMMKPALGGYERAESTVSSQYYFIRHGFKLGLFNKLGTNGGA